MTSLAALVAIFTAGVLGYTGVVFWCGTAWARLSDDPEPRTAAAPGASLPPRPAPPPPRHHEPPASMLRPLPAPLPAHHTGPLPAAPRLPGEIAAALAGLVPPAPAGPPSCACGEPGRTGPGITHGETICSTRHVCAGPPPRSVFETDPSLGPSLSDALADARLWAARNLPPAKPQLC